LQLQLHSKQHFLVFCENSFFPLMPNGRKNLYK
jgi:hypothetical protein